MNFYEAAFVKLSPQSQITVYESLPRSGSGASSQDARSWLESAVVQCSAAMNEVTRILSTAEHGDPQAAKQLLPLVYEELRRLAAQRLVQETTGQTLQPTALVHEAYLRLVGTEKGQHWDCRGHFFAAAAEAMRRILIENARRKLRLKRGGGGRRVDLDEVDAIASAWPGAQDEFVTPEDLLALHDALDRLAEEDARKARVVQLRFFAGLSVEEVAHLLGISRATADRDWAYARAWLYDHLHPGDANTSDEISAQS